MNSISLNAQGNQFRVGAGRTAINMQTKQWAEQQFEMAYGKAKRSQFWARLRRKDDGLLTLDVETAVVQSAAPQKMTLSVADIKGTAGGKVEAFDAQFRPTAQHSRDRWISIATANKTHRRLPPIQVTKVNDSYFVVDGHHRLSVAQWLGIDEIEAIVTEATAA